MSNAETGSIVLAFDVYGTLLDTSQVKHALVTHVGVSGVAAVEISALWRRYQLECDFALTSRSVRGINDCHEDTPGD